MFLWFIATAVLTVWWVFRDPAFDHRLLIVGSLLPLVDLAFGGARALHSVTVALVVLAVLMVATTGRRPIRRTLLGLPIGLLLHLVFTGAWRHTAVFWWPFTGLSFADRPHPVVARGWWNLPLELAGLAACTWIVRRSGLRERGPRSWFRRTGRLALPRPD